ncbi:MAG: anaerobic ribonucleoside-triphosphate reductase activating protein [Candidatus Micrarchaeota archaeon]
MKIKGFVMSFVDYPDNVCLTIFTGGCNYRCPFCHNADLVLSPEKFETVPLERMLFEITKRKKLIDGITISGGEPLLNENIMELITPVKEMGLAVKLDTNGAFPEQLKKLLDSGMLDYVAMDIKTSPEKYSEACGIDVNFEQVRKSAELLRASPINYEFRTTAVPGLVEKEDINNIGEWLFGAKNYYLQQFAPTGSLSAEYRKKRAHPPEKLAEFAKLAGRYFLNVGVRGL